MAIITLEDAKAHLGVTLDDDDTLITGKIEAAQAAIEQLLGYEIEDRFDTVPGDLKEAVRQLTAHYFENREAAVIGVSAGFVPLGVADIVRNRRDWMLADA
jgi:uncharacterized phage protein (predicted DNA packaging)